MSGKINDADHRLAVDRETDLDREVAVLFYKSPRAVDRIRDPDTAVFYPLLWDVGLFLRENVSRPGNAADRPSTMIRLDARSATVTGSAKLSIPNFSSAIISRA